MTKDEATQIAVLSVQMHTLEAMMDEMKQDNKEMKKTIDNMDRRITKQTGFAFGVLGAASTIGGVIGWGLSQFKEKIFG